MRRLVLLAMKSIMPMAGSMDELDNRIMALRWRYESRERRRDFVYFILEKRCSQQ